MATAHPAGPDPRTQAVEQDVRPTVAPPPRGAPIWLIAGGFALAAILLFVVLDSRRRALTAPTVQARGVDAYGRAAAPPPTLFVPPAPAPAPVVVPIALATPAPSPAPPPQIYYPPPPQQQQVYQSPIDMSPPVRPATPIAAVPPRNAGGQTIVFDSTQADPVQPAAASGSVGANNPGGTASALGERARASVLRNQSTTVPQGTLIPAVLETALDSTRAGLVRALVQRDVVGFDGTKILIPRGSRLIGDYRSDLRPGQNRASVIWNRLVRPDGVTIALASPAADTLGRTGIKGSVNSHFLARFGAAILQSTLDVGVALAGRSGNNNGVIIGAPALTSNGSALLLGNGNQVQPTLTVRQGTSLMVFVSRDLDFTGVERR